MKTAYLQGKVIDRYIIVRPSSEAKTDKLWKLNKAVYGLKDPARVWYDTVVDLIYNTGGAT